MKKVLFVGSPNAFPMHYALEMKHFGYEVDYLVDVDKNDTLSRPEHQFYNISYPYPEWIIESPIKKQHWRAFFPRLLFRRYINICKNYDVVILSGHYVSLAEFIKNKHVIGLFVGADLYYQSNPDRAKDWAKEGRIIPYFLKFIFAKKIMTNNYNSLEKLNSLIYFPIGLNPDATPIVNHAIKNGVNYISRYDLNHKVLGCYLNHKYVPNIKHLNIICPTRISFYKLSGGDRSLDKGNDKIIHALSRFKKVHPHFTVHFFEKGPDVELAKEMCNKLGLDNNVVWHKQMPLPNLLELYSKADICFDQIGTHWISAVGCYALFMGIPLIANARVDVLEEFWGDDNPICHATNADDIYLWLVKLIDVDLRSSVSIRSKKLAESRLKTDRVTNLIIDDIEKEK